MLSRSYPVSHESIDTSTARSFGIHQALQVSNSHSPRNRETSGTLTVNDPRTCERTPEKRLSKAKYFERRSVIGTFGRYRIIVLACRSSVCWLHIRQAASRALLAIVFSLSY